MGWWAWSSRYIKMIFDFTGVSLRFNNCSVTLVIDAMLNQISTNGCMYGTFVHVLIKCLSWMTIFCVWSKHVKWGIPSPSPLSNFLSCVMKLSSVHAGSLPFLSWTYFPFFRLLEPNSNQIFTSLLHYIHVSLYYFINCIYYFVRIWGSCMRGEFHVNKFLFLFFLFFSIFSLFEIMRLKDVNESNS